MTPDLFAYTPPPPRPVDPPHRGIDTQVAAANDAITSHKEAR